MFVAEKSGLIKVFSSLSDATPSVVADLRTNVHNYWDRGLLGMTLSPTFPTEPSIYVLYTYDHILGSGGGAPRWGAVDGTSDSCPTPPGPTADGCVVSGRLSRLQLSGDTQVGPEQVLIEDWCQQFPSHSIGSLAFGADGMLYVSGGDGASFSLVDYGQEGDPVNPCGDPPVAVGEGQTAPTAEGGSLRSQALRGAAPSSATNYASVVADDGPLGYWRLGEASGAVVDAIGSNNGTVSGAVTRDVAGALASGDDGAILFNGSTGAVRMGDVLDVTAGSYELWIKRSNTTAALQYMMDKGAGQPNIALGSDHLIYVGEENVWWLASTVTINDTNWHHIVFTHPGGATSGLARLYIDGVDRTLTLSGANLVANSSNLSVGAGYGDFLHFAGAIDEVALYGRALATAEVTDHFQAGRNGTGPSLPKTLDGSILRVDPTTGAAAAGNPNASSTDPNVRRIIAHGLRNPFRITTRPGTNELWVGDVGWNLWRRSTGSWRGVTRSSRTSAGRATRALDASRDTTAQT